MVNLCASCSGRRTLEQALNVRWRKLHPFVAPVNMITYTLVLMCELKVSHLGIGIDIQTAIYAQMVAKFP
jgi:hypothetical protein